MNNSQVFDLIEKVASRPSGWTRTPAAAGMMEYDALKRTGMPAAGRSNLALAAQKASAEQNAYTGTVAGNTHSAAANKSAMKGVAPATGIHKTVAEAGALKKQTGVGRMLTAKNLINTGGAEGAAAAKAMGVTKSGGRVKKLLMLANKGRQAMGVVSGGRIR